MCESFAPNKLALWPKPQASISRQRLRQHPGTVAYKNRAAQSGAAGALSPIAFTKFIRRHRPPPFCPRPRRLLQILSTASLRNLQPFF